MPGSALISPSLEVILLYLGIPSFRCLSAGVFVAGGGHVDVFADAVEVGGVLEPRLFRYLLGPNLTRVLEILGPLEGGGGARCAGHVLCCVHQELAQRTPPLNCAENQELIRSQVTIIRRQLPLRGLS